MPTRTQPPPIQAHVPKPSPRVWLWRRLVRYGPGVALLAAVGYLALLSSYYLTGLSYVPAAILLGAFISNTFGVHPALEKGIGTYELWLKAGIVLLGSQVAFLSIGVFWLQALPVAALTVALTLLFMLWLGRILRIPPRLAALLAAGTGVCGVSAVIHTAPAIGAEDDEVEFAVGAVLVMGAAAILLYPIAGSVLGLPETVYGFWSGLSVNNTAEAVATGYSYGSHAGSIAIATKLCRVVMLGATVSFLSTRSRGPSGKRAGLMPNRQWWTRLPKFAALFFLVSLLASAGMISAREQQSLGNLSSWLFLMAFAGIGFKLRWRDIRNVGLRPVLAVGVGGFVLGILTLGVSIALSSIIV